MSLSEFSMHILFIGYGKTSPAFKQLFEGSLPQQRPVSTSSSARAFTPQFAVTAAAASTSGSRIGRAVEGTSTTNSTAAATSTAHLRERGVVEVKGSRVEKFSKKVAQASNGAWSRSTRDIGLAGVTHGAVLGDDLGGDPLGVDAQAPREQGTGAPGVRDERRRGRVFTSPVFEDCCAPPRRAGIASDPRRSTGATVDHRATWNKPSSRGRRRAGRRPPRDLAAAHERHELIGSRLSAELVDALRRAPSRCAQGREVLDTPPAPETARP